ncbi:protease complex subunit PrcB family protein [Marinobacter sp. VGCF2001]|uniref:protease complex subunit PrcB family protein n=1 Tax=Marinobacter sp. VGCF2001 TaxID=3417189 RepID=UPI003CE73154
MNKALAQCLVTLAASLLLGACSATGSAETAGIVNVRQITQSAHCGLTGPGVAFVRSEAEREALLDVSGQNMATDAVRKVALEQEALVLVTLGQKPTAGYSIGLNRAHRQGQTLALHMRVREPAPDRMVAQVITSPCVVLAVEPGDWHQITVSGVTEEALVRKLEH